MQLGASQVTRRNPSDALGGLIPHARFTTTLILLINFGMYAATVIYSMKAEGAQGLGSIDVQTLYLFGAKYPPAIFGLHQWWRLITAGFLHGGILHILMNSWVIFDLGAQVEEFFGTSRYLVLYFLSNIGGFLASSYWSGSISVGASAALFGLIGAMIALGMKTQSSMGAAMKAHYTQWAVYGLIMGLLPGFHVDNAAHIGGLITGFLVGYVAGTPSLRDNTTEKLWRIAAACCVVITLAAFAMMFLHFSVAHNELGRSFVDYFQASSTTSIASIIA
jgi:rhomboid protease GluP